MRQLVKGEIYSASKSPTMHYRALKSPLRNGEREGGGGEKWRRRDIPTINKFL